MDWHHVEWFFFLKKNAVSTKLLSSSYFLSFIGAISKKKKKITVNSRSEVTTAVTLQNIELLITLFTREEIKRLTLF